MTSEYKTDFKLSNPVNDIMLAQWYLSEDDMTQYLDDDDKKVVESIRWVLETPDSGTIQVTTKRPLTPEESTKISSWISGQNSDGLGEGFEQQDFALIEIEEPYYDDETDEYHEGYYEYAGFDWGTNTYPLRLV